jgi:large subunit ribosomal protein L4
MAVRLIVKNTQGEEVDTIEVDDRVFGIKPNRAVVHQALLAHLANRRAGTASTKTRGEVRGSTAKIRRQKGTGRARLGSIRAPHLTGGGVVFGPRPRSFAQRLPKRVRRLAIRSVLSDKVAEGRLQVLDRLTLERPRTKDMAGVLTNLEVSGSALIVTGEPDRNVLLGARNLPETKVLSAAYLNVVDLLSHRALIMTVDAVRKAEALWGGERALRRRSQPTGEQVAVGEGS